MECFSVICILVNVPKEWLNNLVHSHHLQWVINYIIDLFKSKYVHIFLNYKSCSVSWRNDLLCTGSGVYINATQLKM
jgi:hypothetical protein